MKTFILTSYDKDRKVTVEDGVRVRAISNQCSSGIVLFTIPGRHYNEDDLIAMVSNVDVAYEEGTNVQVRTTVPGVPENKGKWENV